MYEASGAVPYRPRALEQFIGYFDGLELIEPGVVPVIDWRPDTYRPDMPQVGGAGRKP